MKGEVEGVKKVNGELRSELGGYRPLAGPLRDVQQVYVKVRE